MVSSSVDVSTPNTRLSAQVKDTLFPNRPLLSLSVSVLKNEVVRVTLDETKPLFPRFTVRDVLMEAALIKGAAGIRRAEQSLLFHFGDKGEFQLTVTLEPEPLLIELRLRDKPGRTLCLCLCYAWECLIMEF